MSTSDHDQLKHILLYIATVFVFMFLMFISLIFIHPANAYINPKDSIKIVKCIEMEEGKSLCITGNYPL